jgi:hypothetical protein
MNGALNYRVQIFARLNYPFKVKGKDYFGRHSILLLKGLCAFHHILGREKTKKVMYENPTWEKFELGFVYIRN